VSAFGAAGGLGGKDTLGVQRRRRVQEGRLGGRVGAKPGDVGSAGGGSGSAGPPLVCPPTISDSETGVAKLTNRLDYRQSTEPPLDSLESQLFEVPPASSREVFFPFGNPRFAPT